MKDNYLDNLSDEEFAEFLRPMWEAHEEYLASKSNDDFRPNKENVDRLVAIMESVHALMEDNDLKLKPVTFEPKERNVSFTVTFNYLWLEGMEYLSALRAMMNADSIEISATLDGKVEISGMVYDVFAEKANNE